MCQRIVNPVVVSHLRRLFLGWVQWVKLWIWAVSLFALLLFCHWPVFCVTSSGTVWPHSPLVPVQLSRVMCTLTSFGSADSCERNWLGPGTRLARDTQRPGHMLAGILTTRTTSGSTTSGADIRVVAHSQASSDTCESLHRCLVQNNTVCSTAGN